MMAKYRKKPVVIEAFQWTAQPIDDWPLWAKKAWATGRIKTSRGSSIEDVTSLYITTLEGTMTAVKGDWIIRGIKKELYPCNPLIFAATYEAVE